MTEEWERQTNNSELRVERPEKGARGETPRGNNKAGAPGLAAPELNLQL